MSVTHLESWRVSAAVESARRRGKSLFEALAIAAMEANIRQERYKSTITEVWIDEANQIPEEPPCD